MCKACGLRKYDKLSIKAHKMRLKCVKIFSFNMDDSILNMCIGNERCALDTWISHEVNEVGMRMRIKHDI